MSSAAAAGSAAARATPVTDVMTLRPMPAGRVWFGRLPGGRLSIRTDMFGLTPGSRHDVDLVMPGRHRSVRFRPLLASSAGQASSTLPSSYTGRVPAGSHLVIRMGAGGSRIAAEPIARTARLRHPGRRPHHLQAVEVSPAGARYGTPRGRATVSYSAKHRTLTVTVSASGITPGPHAAHIHLGSCQSQGPVLYMLRDLVASRRGRVVHAVRVFTHVMTAPPGHGWYLNIHQGNSDDILRNGNPTILFRPLICANINSSGAGSVSAILRSGDVVTGVRGSGGADVVLTGGVATGDGTQNDPFLYQGTLGGAAAGAAVSVRTAPFAGETSATFYGPDTHAFNPASIPAGQVRAVGSYTSSSAPAGVVNQGLIYLGPVRGPGGSWTSIDVPADGSRTTRHMRACPRTRPHCIVMDTIAHSTVGNLIVGDYDLRPPVPGGAISANGFLYNLSTHRWTLLDLGGTQSSQTTLYGIWQDGGPGSRTYTLAGGSAASGHKRAFLMDYNEATGRFGTPRYFHFGNGPALVTHFEGITAVAGGFNLVAMSTAQYASVAFVPVRHRTGSFGRARWHPLNVTGSALCSGGCTLVTGNTVYRNRVMGLYLPAGATLPGSYLAVVPPAT